MTVRKAPARGFSLFELAVTVCVIGVLAGVLLSRVTWFKDEAEKAARENVVGVLRSALNMRASQLIAQGKQQDLDKLLTINPMDLLAQKPANYMGEYYSPQKEKIPAGNWYFNRKKLLLVYIRRTGATNQTPEPQQFFYQIKLLRNGDDADGPNHAETSDSTTIEGVILQQIPM